MTKTMEVLYRRIFPAVARYVARRGGTLEEAKDVFHDALLVYHEKTFNRPPILRLDEGAYIFGVARHLWIKRYAENQRYASLDKLIAGLDGDSGMDWADDPQSGEPAPATQRILRVLQTAGQRCMQLLTSFYYERLDMQELARRFGFSGTRSATVQKFKCLEKVRQVVKEKSLHYEDFVG